MNLSKNIKGELIETTEGRDWEVIKLSIHYMLVTLLFQYTTYGTFVPLSM